ncbi:MAG TPA: hypothetical protein VIH42_02140, partial [Thermoguttaceae bacterium]
MATDTRTARNQSYYDQEFPGEFKHTRPKRGRWLWRLCVFLILLGALVWFLPVIITKTPLLGWIIQKATGNLNGAVSIQSASLGWLSPISVSGIQVSDQQNKPVLSASAISSDKPLLQILCDYTRLGRFRIEKPAISLVLRSDGSNLEDMLASFQTGASEKKSSTNIAIDLEIVDGTLKIIDQMTNQNWQFEKVNANFNMPADGVQPIILKASAQLANAGQPGSLTADVKYKSAPDEKTSSSGDLAAQVENLPLAMVQSLAARYLPQSRLEGILDCEIHALWGGEGAEQKMIVQADALAERFAFTSSALGTDVVQLPRVRAVGRASKSGDRLDIEKTSLECDLGNIALTSSMNLKGQGNALSTASLLRQRHELSGRVDLARLAAMLPGTLCIRKETQITSGQLEIAFSSQERAASTGSAQAGADGQNVMVWHGQIDADNLVAVDNGRQFAWVKPIAATFDAHDTPQGPVVDSLKCESDFLKIHAAGTPNDLTASLSFELKRLADQLGQFVDLGKVQLAGDGWSNVNWKRNAQQQFETDAELQLHNLQVLLPEKQPWKEESLLIYVSAKGKTDGTSNTQLDAASLNVKAGDDRLAAQLLKPVADLKQGGIWPVRLLMQGQL